MTQQFIGLTLFVTFSSYFFQQSGIKDPFQATCITSSIHIIASIIIIFTTDKIGRRLICCCGSMLSWLACVAVGILGVAPDVKASNDLIFFACLWSKALLLLRSRQSLTVN